MENKHHLNNGRRLSEVLLTLPEKFGSDFVTIEQLRDALPKKVFGIFLIILALPNLVPIPAPGLSAILGIPLLMITFQMMLGYKKPWLPKSVLSKGLKKEHLQMVCRYVVPYIVRIEKFCKPRLLVLIYPPTDRIIDFVCIFLSLLIMLPLPFGNALPALSICFFALAFLQHDGVFVIIGTITGTIATIIVAASFSAVFMALEKFLLYY